MHESNLKEVILWVGRIDNFFGMKYFLVCCSLGFTLWGNIEFTGWRFFFAIETDQIQVE